MASAAPSSYDGRVPGVLDALLEAERWVRPDRQAARATGQTKGTGKKKPKGAGPGAGRYDESKHRRGAAGTSQGGKFIATGSSGSDVKTVQGKVGIKAPDGSFDYNTKAAVMDFQRRHGLQVDGVVGHQTAVALAGNFRAAKTAKVGALKGSDHAKLGLKGDSGQSRSSAHSNTRKARKPAAKKGRAPERARGGFMV